ncbi:hypothetical protein BGZ73_003002 [Actinomortierella ambigua]|nr:hypothetical protein BGZ73_003002 [Actinomortierella ambigua]
MACRSLQHSPLEIPEIHAIIVSYLDGDEYLDTLCSLSLVSKQVRTLVLPYLWEDLDLEYGGESWENSSALKESIEKHGAFIRSLSFLCVAEQQIHEDAMDFILRNMPNLRRLDLSTTNVTDNDLKALLRNNSSVGSGPFPRQLRELLLNRCRYVTGACMKTIARLGPQLTHLEMWAIDDVNEEDIQALVYACPNISHLRLNTGKDHILRCISKMTAIKSLELRYLDPDVNAQQAAWTMFSSVRNSLKGLIAPHCTVDDRTLFGLLEWSDRVMATAAATNEALRTNLRGLREDFPDYIFSDFGSFFESIPMNNLFSEEQLCYFGSISYHLTPKGRSNNDDVFPVEIVEPEGYYDMETLPPVQRGFTLSELFKPNTVLTTISFSSNDYITSVGLAVLFEYATELQHISLESMDFAATDHSLTVLAETYSRRLDRLGFHRPSLNECAEGQWKGYDTVPKGLRTLKLKKCNTFTGQGLLRILQTCLGLETLKVMHCKGVVLSDFVTKPWVAYNLIDLTIGNIDVMQPLNAMIQDFWEFPHLTIPEHARFENITSSRYDFVSTDELAGLLESFGESLPPALAVCLEHDQDLQEAMERTPNAPKFLAMLSILPTCDRVKKRLTTQFFTHLGKMRQLKRLDMRYPRFGVGLSDGLDKVAPGLTKTLESWYLDTRYTKPPIGYAEIDWLAARFGYGRTLEERNSLFIQPCFSEGDDDDAVDDDKRNAGNGRPRQRNPVKRRQPQRRKVWVTVPYGYSTDDEADEYECYITSGRNISRLKLLVLGLFRDRCDQDVLMHASCLRDTAMDGVILRSSNFPDFYYSMAYGLDVEDPDLDSDDEPPLEGSRGITATSGSATTTTQETGGMGMSAWNGYSSATDGESGHQRRVLCPSRAHTRRTVFQRTGVMVPNQPRKWITYQNRDALGDDYESDGEWASDEGGMPFDSNSDESQSESEGEPGWPSWGYGEEDYSEGEDDVVEDSDDPWSGQQGVGDEEADEDEGDFF